MRYNEEFLTKTLEQTDATLISAQSPLNTRSVIYFGCSCGNENSKQFISIVKFGAFCKSCTKSRKLEKSKENSLLRYGVEYPSQLPEVTAKRIQTNITRCGAPYFMMVPEYKQKRVHTYLDRYGVENISQLESIKEKKKQSYLERYGVEHPLKNPEVVSKKVQSMKKNKTITAFNNLNFRLESQTI